VNATIEGVVRSPSLFSITFGLPPSMIATQEFVVPKSIPITLPIFVRSKKFPKTFFPKNRSPYGVTPKWGEALSIQPSSPRATITLAARNSRS
jgi:hypothetical protein